MSEAHFRMYDGRNLKLLIRSQPTGLLKLLSLKQPAIQENCRLFLIGFFKRPTDHPLHATYASFPSRNLDTPAMGRTYPSQSGDVKALYCDPLGCGNLDGYHSSPSFEDRSSPTLMQYGPPCDPQNLNYSKTLQNSQSLTGRSMVLLPKCNIFRVF